MIGWAEASLYEAINCLTRAGKNHLASDLNRLLDALDFDELEVFRNPASEAIADQLLEVSTFPDLVDLLRQFSEAIGVSHCTLHVVTELPSTAFTTRALTTYPEAWVTRYFNRRYYSIDPVLRASAAAETGFFWDTLQVTDPTTLAFYHDAKTHGVGPSGYTLPIITERGDKIAISVSSPEDRDAFRDRIHHVEQDLLTVGFCITEAFARLASEDRPTEFALTDDQMAILRSVAMGAGEERAARGHLPLRLLPDPRALDLRHVPHPDHHPGHHPRRPRRPPHQRPPHQVRHPRRLQPRPPQPRRPHPQRHLDAPPDQDAQRRPRRSRDGRRGIGLVAGLLVSDAASPLAVPHGPPDGSPIRASPEPKRRLSMDSRPVRTPSAPAEGVSGAAGTVGS